MVRLLGNLGYEPYEDGWYHREEIIALEKRALRLARNRRRDLELPARFVLHRRARLRVFTDLDIARDAWYRERLFRRLRGAVTAYRQLFLPFALDEKWEGLDVVIIEKHEDYALETGAPDTVGLFLPARRASYYSFARFGTADAPGAVRVLFHEVCHQLDYKLLRMIHRPIVMPLPSMSPKSSSNVGAAG